MCKHFKLFLIIFTLFVAGFTGAYGLDKIQYPELVITASPYEFDMEEYPVSVWSIGNLGTAEPFISYLQIPSGFSTTYGNPTGAQIPKFRGESLIPTLENIPLDTPLMKSAISFSLIPNMFLKDIYVLSTSSSTFRGSAYGFGSTAIYNLLEPETTLKFSVGLDNFSEGYFVGTVAGIKDHIKGIDKTVGVIGGVYYYDTDYKYTVGDYLRLYNFGRMKSGFARAKLYKIADISFLYTQNLSGVPGPFLTNTYTKDQLEMSLLLVSLNIDKQKIVELLQGSLVGYASLGYFDYTNTYWQNDRNTLSSSLDAKTFSGKMGLEYIQNIAKIGVRFGVNTSSANYTWLAKENIYRNDYNLSLYTFIKALQNPVNLNLEVIGNGNILEDRKNSESLTNLFTASGHAGIKAIKELGNTKLSIWVSAEKINRIPTLMEYYSAFGNKNLSPETGIGGESGINVSAKLGEKSSLSLSLIPYYYKYENLIIFDLSSFSYTNLNSVEKQGLDVNVNGHITLYNFAINVGISGNINVSKDKDNKYIPYIPTKMLKPFVSFGTDYGKLTSYVSILDFSTNKQDPEEVMVICGFNGEGRIWEYITIGAEANIIFGRNYFVDGYPIPEKLLKVYTKVEL